MRALCLGVIGLLWAVAIGAETETADLADLYRSGRFEAATDVLQESASSPETAEDLFWRYCLNTDPLQAESIFRTLAASDDPEARRLAGLLHGDLAWIRYGATEPDSVLSLLLQTEIMASASESASDDADTAYLKGLALKASGRGEAAVAAFEDAIVIDPRDGWSHLQLARLALNRGETPAALNHVRAILQIDDSPCRPNALMLQWKLIVGHDPKTAKAIEQELLQVYPGSFAQTMIGTAARERERLQTSLHSELITLPLDSLLSDEPPPMVGDYSLALAEFSDRGRALAFVEIWRDSIRGLTINSQRLDRGRLSYLVIGGRFPSRAQAARYAEILDDDYDLDSRIIDLESGN